VLIAIESLVILTIWFTEPRYDPRWQEEVFPGDFASVPFRTDEERDDQLVFFWIRLFTFGLVYLGFGGWTAALLTLYGGVPFFQFLDWMAPPWSSKPPHWGFRSVFFVLQFFPLLIKSIFDRPRLARIPIGVILYIGIVMLLDIIVVPEQPEATIDLVYSWEPAEAHLLLVSLFFLGVFGFFWAWANEDGHDPQTTFWPESSLVGGFHFLMGKADGKPRLSSWLWCIAVYLLTIKFVAYADDQIKNQERDQQWYERQVQYCEAGDNKACGKAGLSIAESEVYGDYETASRYLEKGCDAGVGSHCWSLNNLQPLNSEDRRNVGLDLVARTCELKGQGRHWLFNGAQWDYDNPCLRISIREKLKEQVDPHGSLTESQ
jgi:hypothetical protein